MMTGDFAETNIGAIKYLHCTLIIMGNGETYLPVINNLTENSNRLTGSSVCFCWNNCPTYNFTLCWKFLRVTFLLTTTTQEYWKHQNLGFESMSRSETTSLWIWFGIGIGLGCRKNKLQWKHYDTLGWTAGGTKVGFRFRSLFESNKT